MTLLQGEQTVESTWHRISLEERYEV
ncbi:hypothetical protein RRG08_027872 [Elysia crispata]|uniref:Uncharacterized protein n=1 Tax=Elysia crispata TaxID=231223 RepID=A0AAE1DTG5_9GAST|nr:hypothetical protein RRG08_027872 [Elysia crispata]